ncbi:MAG: hypothetical protein EBY23_08575 [Actinobacteria bacterium]|nr:hypothetical protein [Actinomycetota bacterium]
MANNYPAFKSRSESARRVLQRGARGIAAAEKAASKGVAFWRRAGFPFRAPSVPRGVSVPPKEPHLGAYFDTSFARKPAARAVRRILVAGPVTGMVKFLARPKVEGIDRLSDLAKRTDVGGVIFAPNHHSHIDTPLMTTAVPSPSY